MYIYIYISLLYHTLYTDPQNIFLFCFRLAVWLIEMLFWDFQKGCRYWNICQTKHEF